MTSKENIVKLLTHNNPERIGIFDHWWPETLTEWVENGYPTTVDDNGNTVPEAPEKVFDYDLIPIGGAWFNSQPIYDFKEIVEETDEWFVEKNGAGASYKFWKHKSGTPEHVSFEMSDFSIWEKNYKPHMLELNPKRVDLKEIVKNKEYVSKNDKFGFYNNIFVFEWLRNALGDVCMYESMLLEPEWIEDITNTLFEMYKKHYTYIYENVGKPDAMWLYEDMGYNKGLLCSPNSMRKLIYPMFKKMTGWFKENGLDTMLHSCGNITEGIDDFIESGFISLNPMEVKAGCNVVEYAKKYKDKLAFSGGMDIRIMETNDKDIIKKDIVRLCTEMKSMNAMWIFGSDHSISPRVNYDTYRFILDTVRENMYY